MRIALFHRPGLIAWRVDGELQHTRVLVPRFSLTVGHSLYRRIWGVEITVGTLGSRRQGEDWARWRWSWGIRHETLFDHPWTWWSPVRPIIDAMGLFGFEIAWPWSRYRRIVHWSPWTNRLRSRR